ncbi:MAG: tetratricopeptide repeat protein [Candidatus Eremiobacteraeota bacterium]|nr:tetratricopeptide repeat protein [Candidatus Eremiobacteraeota bacterium]
MHCPACNKDFSPVHSRCPDCNGWLRTAKSNGAPSRPGAGVAAPGGLAAGTPSEPATQRIGGSAGVTLPSRPSAKPAAAPAPVQAPAVQAPAARAGGDWGAPQAPAPTLGGPPASAPRMAPAEDTGFGGRGGLGSGWESSGSFAAPTPVPPPAASQWGGDGLATGRLQAPAAPQTGWGSNLGQAPAPGGLSGGPAASGWGAPAAPNSAPLGGGGGGWGAPAAPPASPGLGGGNFGGGSAAAGPPGLGGPPSASGSWGSPPAASPPGPAPGGGGGGWLGDGGGGQAAAPSPYAAPAARSGESWLGGGDAPAAPSSLGPPPASEMKLELPDHTVAVDLGTPWEDEEHGGGTSSNKMIYVILGCLVLSLTVFSAYLYWQNNQLKQKPAAPPVASSETSAKLGEDYWKKAQASFAAKRYEEAQQSAELARDLLVGLKGYPKTKQISAFYNKATSRWALALFDQAKRANSAGETNQAIGLCNQAAQMYSRIKGSSKQQASAFAYEGRIYEGLGDKSAAESSYRKAHSLSPGSGYDRLAGAARRSGAPVVSAPAPGPADPPPSVEQPSLGDGGLYPTGHGSGGYRAPAPGAPPPAVPSGPAPRPRVVNNYVPPKKTTSARKSDQLPTYNH